MAGRAISGFRVGSGFGAAGARPMPGRVRPGAREQCRWERRSPRPPNQADAAAGRVGLARSSREAKGVWRRSGRRARRGRHARATRASSGVEVVRVLHRRTRFPRTPAHRVPTRLPPAWLLRPGLAVVLVLLLAGAVGVLVSWSPQRQPGPDMAMTHPVPPQPSLSIPPSPSMTVSPPPPPVVTTGPASAAPVSRRRAPAAEYSGTATGGTTPPQRPTPGGGSPPPIACAPGPTPAPAQPSGPVESPASAPQPSCTLLGLPVPLLCDLLGHPISELVPTTPRQRADTVP